LHRCTGRAAYAPFFSLSPRPPPSSPLFPYTTLFRSLHQPAEAHEPLTVSWLTSQRRRSLARQMLHFLGVEIENDAFVSAIHQPADRKSTRLNSSHVAISYAVFCLKKKKRPPTRTPSA